MAKFYGSATKSGRVGGSVFAIRHGETIERQYQPVVMNPKTAKQVTSRASLKLLSQVSGSLNSIIAFRRVGNVSPRNIFVSKNYRAVSEAEIQNGEVSVKIDVNTIDLTGGVAAIPVMTSPVVTGNNVAVGLNSGAADNISRVLYALVGIKEGTSMFVLDVVVVEDAGGSRTFDGSLTLPEGASGNMAIFAYGVADLNETARLTYENYKVAGSPAAAVLSAIRTLSVKDVMLTETIASSFTVA